MKKLSVTAIITFIVITLSGCANKSTSPNLYNEETFKSNNKAIAFIQIAQGDDPKEAQPLGYTLKKLSDSNSESIHVDPPSTFFSTHSTINYAKNIIMLTPGIYYFDKITLFTEDNIIYWLSPPGFLNKEIVYGAFEVKAEDVISLGKLVISNDSNPHFKVYDDIEKVRKDLNKAGYTDLANRVKVRTFYNSGSAYLKNNKGKTELVSNTEIEEYEKKLLSIINTTPTGNHWYYTVQVLPHSEPLFQNYDFSPFLPAYQTGN